MSTATILIIVLIVLLVLAMPTWGYSRNFGAWPGGMIGIVLLIVLILFLTGHL